MDYDTYRMGKRKRVDYSQRNKRAVTEVIPPELITNP